MRARCILILVILSMLFSPVHACDCVQNTLDHSIKYTDLIITGKFIQGEKIWELSQQEKDAPAMYYTGTFVVTQVLKGKMIKAGDTLQIASDFTNCSTLYKNKTNYLLFASSETAGIKTTVCSYSGWLNEKKTKKHLKQTKQLLRNRQITGPLRKYS